MYLPHDAAHDIPFEVVEMSLAEKMEILKESDPEKRKALEAKYTLVYEGPRFRRRFDTIPGQTGQQSLEQARFQPPLGATPGQVEATLKSAVAPAVAEAEGHQGPST